MSASEGCSKEGSTSDGYPCRYACCPARTAAKTTEPPRQRGVLRESYTPEDSSRFYKENLSEEAERKPMSDKSACGGGSGHHLLKTLSSANPVLASMAVQTQPPSTSDCMPDSPIDWKLAPREKDLKKWRDMDPACLNGAQVWRERGDKRERVLAPGMESVVSPPPPPPRRAVRSETPDDDSVSFHETLGRELR